MVLKEFKGKILLLKTFKDRVNFLRNFRNFRTSGRPAIFQEVLKQTFLPDALPVTQPTVSKQH